MKIQGFESSIDVLRALMWRHNEAVNLQSLGSNKQDALDVLNNDFWEDWYNDVFNLQTANAFGLTVWSIILGISITVSPDPEVNPNNSWGFGPFRKNFNNGNFSPSIDPIVLNPEQARTVLKLRYYQMITRSTVPECNEIAVDVFGPGVYVLDGNDMTMSYVFGSALDEDTQFIIEEFDLLPRSSGVGVNIVIEPNTGFGYGEFRFNYSNAGYGL